ncbi:cuticle protein 19-like [Panulirus ornatus]|uniref:cuticle protein 19-like n=1 Tax=Panulirus ornatus TaxID=150431 RepID=UPI003A850C52
MSSIKMVLVTMVAAITLASPRPDSPPVYGAPPSYKQLGMPYDFAYAVKDDYTSNDFAHDENSDGSLTSGSYRVVLPDGRTQRVTFTADHHNGYRAQVAYDGQASYPAPASYI